tara:strand:+ start:262 stop:768 length:507 start_codon:yes stop_codon:yes gene_type:complete
MNTELQEFLSILPEDKEKDYVIFSGLVYGYDFANKYFTRMNFYFDLGTKEDKIELLSNLENILDGTQNEENEKKPIALIDGGDIVAGCAYSNENEYARLTLERIRSFGLKPRIKLLLTASPHILDIYDQVVALEIAQVKAVRYTREQIHKIRNSNTSFKDLLNVKTNT